MSPDTTVCQKEYTISDGSAFAYLSDDPLDTQNKYALAAISFSMDEPAINSRFDVGKGEILYIDEDFEATKMGNGLFAFRETAEPENLERAFKMLESGEETTAVQICRVFEETEQKGLEQYR